MNDQGLMPNHRNELRSKFGIIQFLASAVAAPIELFIHRLGSFGERYFGFQFVAAAGFMVFWPVLCSPHHDPRPTLAFCFASVFMYLCARSRTVKRIRKGGPQPHTRYSGEPWLKFVFRRMNETKIKFFVEPVLVFIGGALVMSLSPPLGGFFIVSGLGMFIANSTSERFERRRALDMHDALVEQRSVVERFRELQDRN
ncbi:MAG: hypothetical protein KF841_09285 [Phycisphaerae bacterium]|nr:hypothetical protein [Phycisphaerae bacterium]